MNDDILVVALTLVGLGFMMFIERIGLITSKTGLIIGLTMIVVGSIME